MNKLKKNNGRCYSCDGPKVEGKDVRMLRTDEVKEEFCYRDDPPETTIPILRTARQGKKRWKSAQNQYCVLRKSNGNNCVEFLRTQRRRKGGSMELGHRVAPDLEIKRKVSRYRIKSLIVLCVFCSLAEASPKSFQEQLDKKLNFFLKKSRILR